MNRVLVIGLVGCVVVAVGAVVGFAIASTNAEVQARRQFFGTSAPYRTRGGQQMLPNLK